jgi:hypothetical protein
VVVRVSASSLDPTAEKQLLKILARKKIKTKTIE